MPKVILRKKNRIDMNAAIAVLDDPRFFHAAEGYSLLKELSAAACEALDFD